MQIIIGQPIIVDNVNNTTYTSVTQHRGIVNGDKSRWTIQLSEELACFKLAYTRRWHADYRAWGLHVVQDRITVLGKSALGEQLKIAKFVDSSKDENWHGYPADYRGNIQDRPPQGILEKWRADGLIKKHHIAKIRSGKACNL